MKIFITITVLFTLLFLPQTVIADLVVPNCGEAQSIYGVGNMPCQKDEPGLIQIEDAIHYGYIFIANFIINLLILSICYIFIKKNQIFFTLKYMGYTLTVTFAGAMADLIYLGSRYLISFKGPLYPDLALIKIVNIFGICLTSIALFGANYLLARRFFYINKKQSLAISAIMAIFTNPAMLTYIYPLISMVSGTTAAIGIR